MSVSTITTFFPSCASPIPIFAAVVVFPTPPFPDVITMTSLIWNLLVENCSAFSCRRMRPNLCLKTHPFSFAAFFPGFVSAGKIP
jgi:hypothetical protein